MRWDSEYLRTREIGVGFFAGRDRKGLPGTAIGFPLGLTNPPYFRTISSIMPTSKSLIPVEHIQSRILLIRGHKAIIDADLAELYGVTTKRLNEQVRRNSKRFPSDFMFQLTKQEKGEVVAI